MVSDLHEMKWNSIWAPHCHTSPCSVYISCYIYWKQGTEAGLDLWVNMTIWPSAVLHPLAQELSLLRVPSSPQLPWWFYLHCLWNWHWETTACRCSFNINFLSARIFVGWCRTQSGTRTRLVRHCRVHLPGWSCYWTHCSKNQSF